MEENNKMNISRRGFLKATALAGAALAVPTGLDKVFASETKQPETSRTDNESARIREHRVLGTGKAAFEVSALTSHIPQRCTFPSFIRSAIVDATSSTGVSGSARCW